MPVVGFNLYPKKGVKIRKWDDKNKSNVIICATTQHVALDLFGMTGMVFFLFWIKLYYYLAK